MELNMQTAKKLVKADTSVKTNRAALVSNWHRIPKILLKQLGFPADAPSQVLQAFFKNFGVSVQMQFECNLVLNATCKPARCNAFFVTKTAIPPPATQSAVFFF